METREIKERKEVEEIENWRFRLRTQASWTREWRNWIYEKIGIRWKRLILDAGCGTGEITDEIARITIGKVVALDKDKKMLDVAKEVSTRKNKVMFVNSDIKSLPFENDTFDVALCNLVLMWVSSPESAVKELRRVVKKGGFVAATLEPDYGGRIDYPDLPFAKVMINDVQKKGGDPYIGRKLKAIFRRAGLEAEVGILSSLWDDKRMLDNFEDDWKMNETVFLDSGYSKEEIERIKKMEKEFIMKGERLGFFPCFYAIGRKI
ncbi:MAG: class I SAM-dependent methyltransferase [Thermoplasmata archaeon]